MVVSDFVLSVVTPVPGAATGLRQRIRADSGGQHARRNCAQIPGAAQETSSPITVLNAHDRTAAPQGSTTPDAA